MAKNFKIGLKLGQFAKRNKLTLNAALGETLKKDVPAWYYLNRVRTQDGIVNVCGWVQIPKPILNQIYVRHVAVFPFLGTYQTFDGKRLNFIDSDSPLRVSVRDLVISQEHVGVLEHRQPTRREAESDNRGSHWADKRLRILEAAMQIISDSNERTDLFKSDGSLNAEKLAGKIDDQRHRWPALRGKATGLDLEVPSGTSMKTIKETIRSALKGSE